MPWFFQNQKINKIIFGIHVQVISPRCFVTLNFNTMDFGPRRHVEDVPQLIQARKIGEN